MIRAELPQHHFQYTGRFGIDTLEGYHVLIPTMTPVTREILESADHLRLVQQCGAGIEGVDLRAAQELDIWVANVPTGSSGNADSVAELGIYLIIGLLRDFRGMARSMARRKMGQPQGKTLTGRSVGIVGLGGIGRALATRLKPFGVRLMGIKRTHPDRARKELGLDWVGGPEELPRLLQESDFVVLCAPLTAQTRNLMSTDTFSLMKKNSYLINLSRGGLVDRYALERALDSGRIAGAGLDVFWEEPPDPADPIFSHNVLATPHIAGSTDLSMSGILSAVAENIRRLERNQKPLYLQHPES